LRLPNLEGQVPLFISSRNRVAQLYPRGLDSLFVASCLLQPARLWNQFFFMNESQILRKLLEPHTNCAYWSRKCALFIGAFSFVNMCFYLERLPFGAVFKELSDIHRTCVWEVEGPKETSISCIDFTHLQVYETQKRASIVDVVVVYCRYLKMVPDRFPKPSP
jgi:hypothetical protein